MLRRNIYKWHRRISIVIALPVIMWTLSGILHPIMSTFKPKIKHQFLKPIPIEQEKVKLNLGEVLKINGIDAISNFRFIKFNNQLYYQVLLHGADIPIYISTENGKLLKDGDQLYAMELAKRFLDEEGAIITDVRLVREFDDEYPIINRLLPAYRVSFDREDGLRIFVETFGDRMGFAVNDLRYGFSRFFSAFHSWGFLNALGSFRLVVIVVLCSLALFVAVSGIYIYSISKNLVVSANTNSYMKTRKLHRGLSIFVSVTTIMFTFSGGYHAFEKLNKEDNFASYIKPAIQVKQLNWDMLQFFDKIKNFGVLSNLSVASMDTAVYWQASFIGEDKSIKNSYLDLGTLEELEKGDDVYASYLADRYNRNKGSNIASTEHIESFGGEYGFVNKRLPVVKVQYKGNGNERYYVETSSGKLSVRIEDKDLYEGLSFAFFHKFHFVDSLGKMGRDIVTVIAAMANLSVVIVGLILFFKYRNRKGKRVRKTSLEAITE